MWLPWSYNYEVSVEGEVRHIVRKVILKRGIPSTNNYPTVSLIIDGIKKTHRIHHMVATLFLPAPTDPGCEIDHIDRNTLNNNASNLRWVSKTVNNNNKNIQTQCRADKTSDLPHHIQLRTDKSYQCYSICIKHKGKRIKRDRRTIEEAIACRDELIAELNST